MDVFSLAMAGDLPRLQLLVADDPQVLQPRITRERFPAGPHPDVMNILMFTVGLGGSALHAATRGNQAETIRWLIQAGIDPDVRGGYDDQTSLHAAAWHDLVSAAEALLDCGASIDIRSGRLHHNSPAGWAIVAGSADFFEFIMDRGAQTFEFFEADAQAALAGEFLPYTCVPTTNYDRIWKRLQQA